MTDETNNRYGDIARIVTAHYPRAQGVYLFGTYGTPEQRPDSDVDIAVLLPPSEAARCPSLMLTPCHLALEEALGRQVDLLNARALSTVFQKEVVANGRLLLNADEYAVAEFEMLTLSYYQKLNEERREVLEAFQATGKAYDV
ncbi:MAG: nucleotidyltransferase domain-containing protein [SAR202 cluster bacterium]|nr:nucleotidyltransferase domain-containing protein [SAR202 cluster bacterium]